MEGWAHGISWSANLETGNAAIDFQHKGLFKLTSDLAEACASDSCQEVLGTALNFLASYALKHFADEEALLAERNFPDYERHKKLHDNFRAKTVELIAQYEQNHNSANLRAQLNSEVARWLLQHIRKEDLKAAEFIRQKTAGQ